MLKVRDAVPSEVITQRHRRVRQHHDGRENPILHLGPGAVSAAGFSASADFSSLAFVSAALDLI
jgi:hypothetical protein